MNSPRLRMIAGPNGSGKSSLMGYLSTQYSFPLGHCLNPDEFDREMSATGKLELGAYGVSVDETNLKAFVESHPLGGAASATFSMNGSILAAGTGVATNGYLSAMISEYLRAQWVATRQSFTFETVMSSREKLALLQAARGAGYRVYLYYICTNDSAINEGRVAARVLQGGHDVPKEKIEARYNRSLALLPDAVRLSNRAYMFDNSADSHRLIAEFNEGTLVRISEPVPVWFRIAWLNKQ